MIDGLLLMAITYPYNILSMATTVRTVEVHLPMIDGLLLAITYPYNILSMAITYPYNILSMATTVRQ